MPGPKAAPRDNKGRLATEAAKAAFLERLASGESVEAAARYTQRTKRGYDHWRRTDEGFAAQADVIIGRRRDKTVYDVPDFPEFCEQYLRQPLFDHQLRWWDVLSGRAPRDLADSMKWHPGDPQMLLFNVPPGFGKTVTLTVNFVTWRICKDPNVKVIIVSATERMAMKMVGAISARLKNPAYADLQRKFGPDGGFHASAESWTKTEIYLQKTDGEKDPTVQALGMGGQIYGSRADLIVVDDAVLLKNAHQWEDQIEWLTQDVVTRLPEAMSTGSFSPDNDLALAAKMLVVGTRVGKVDLYQKLRDEFRDGDDEPVFTYFAQPAVIEYAEDPADWVSLWPYEANADGEPVVPKWTGQQLRSRRDKIPPATWAMVYQQLDVSEDSVFDPELVQAAVQGMRKPGPLLPGDGHWMRRDGMEGLYVIAGLDPATAGFTAATVIGVDRKTQKMWLLDAYNRKGILPREMRRLIEDWTVKYGVNEWVIENNAFQRSIVQDDSLRSYLFQRGVLLTGHHTGHNKSDPDFGVASMSTLFEPLADGKPTLLLPNDNGRWPAIAQLVEQLLAWQPDTKNQVCDLVMSTWFAVIKARKLLYRSPGRQRQHMVNQFLSTGRARRERQVIDLEALAQEQLYAEMGV